MEDVRAVYYPGRYDDDEDCKAILLDIQDKVNRIAVAVGLEQSKRIEVCHCEDCIYGKFPQNDQIALDGVLVCEEMRRQMNKEQDALVWHTDYCSRAIRK